MKLANNSINTDKQAAALKPGAREYRVRIKDAPGLFLKVTPAGSKSFAAVARDPHGRQRWSTLGGLELTLDEARERARSAIRRVKAGLPGIEPPPPLTGLFETVAKNWLKLYAGPKKLRTLPEIKRILEKYIFPAVGKLDLKDLRRARIAELIDHLAEDHGPRQADIALGIMGRVLAWHQTRDDEYTSPIVRGMTRHGYMARKRILDDGEIRLVWRLAEASGTFGALLRLALLTAQRREKLASMRWDDIQGGVWTVPAGEREKGTGGALVLPDAAVAIIAGQPKVEGNPYVFVGRGDGCFNGWSPSKRAFDRKILAALREAAAKRGEDPAGVSIEPWTIHDLRRTARSLMARARVDRDIAERVLGHVIQGVEGIYDRHAYTAEKADALKKLAGLIDLILNPPASNVVPLHEAAE